MLQRAITGFLFVLVLITAIYFGAYSTLFLFMIIVLLGIDEFYALVKKNKTINPQNFQGVFIGLTSFVLLAFAAQQIMGIKYIMYLIPMFFLTFIIELYRKKDYAFINIAYTLLGVFYVAFPFAMLYHLGFYQENQFTTTFSFQIIIGFFILLWSSDTGAYLAGRFFGKHKLFERISPKKTWEGSIGGGVLSLIAAYVISLFFHNIELKDWMILAIITVVGGGLGDLVESMHKRNLNVKDSGNLLPGHGGILDRFDGLFIAVPFIYAYLIIVSN
jgi:phosphatidate cytidylyltransferase|tara:strand:+ start:133888 stop:134709 length:822 start_codon:yes stop_codon:yes gene_type:complete